MKHIKFYTIIAALFCMVSINAQIGYQVSLLNSATGEPRANETVGVTIEITNSEGTVVCNETKSATTNEFGVLSLQVGSSNTFANMDWSKLPLYISATVDGVMVGRSQILTVPVAEAAKNLVNVAPELICKTWSGNIVSCGGSVSYSITISNSDSFTWSTDGVGGGGKYACYGNIIYFYTTTMGQYACGSAPLNAMFQNGSLYLSTQMGSIIMH